MEPGHRAAEMVKHTFALRLGAACMLLVGLAFVQNSGFLVPDTKFDLVAAPGEFLARALHLWDAEGAFGQLQNQAYGYLWPMGPFFLAGDVLGIPGWAVQRLWLALVLVVACSGAALVARALGVRSDLACIVAGFAFALSPRMLSTLGPISIEAWPSAVTPWVLLPLVVGSSRGSPRRAAVWSALAVAMVGGVNAAASFAVLPLGVVWLLTRTSGPRRRSLMLWWPIFTLLGTLWWLVPLFVMGAYSPPFLDYIETTSVTTFPTTLFDVVRGTSNWVPYLDPGSRAGNDLLRESYLALNSGLLLLLGFAGLIDRRNPHRSFLVLGLLLGTFMVAAGHRGGLEGWFAEDIRALLDGVLSPLRNVHKFDVIVRLPLVIGLAFVLDRVLDGTRDPERPGPRTSTPASLAQVNTLAVVGMALIAVVGAALPALQGRIYPSGATLEVPGYWTETTRWLDENSEDGTALLVPGSGFAEYVWGTTKDEPIQYLADSRWGIRNAIPLAPPGHIRMLDGIEDRLVQGRGSPGLAETLRRAGVRHLVVRNDLARGGDIPDAVLVHQALQQSGLERVTSFGPDVGGASHLDVDGQRVLINGGWQEVYPAVEVYEVLGSSPALGSTSLPLVAAGPEDLADLVDLRVLGEQPVLLAADASDEAAQQTSGVILTDGLRARERSFARIHDGASAVLTPGAVRRSGNPTRDYLIDEDDRWSTTGALRGVAELGASSSASDAGEIGGSRRGQSTAAAVDGTRRTQWVSGFARQGRAWWSVNFEEPRAVSSVVLVGGSSAARDQEVRIRTDSGISEPVALGPGVTRMVRLEGAETTTLRVEDTQDPTAQPLALAEVVVPGLQVERTLVLPALPEGWGAPDQVVLRTDRDARTGCAEIALDVRCVAGRARQAEEPAGLDRTIILNESAMYDAALIVRPRPGRPLVRRLLRDQPLNVGTSSEAVPDVRASGLAAVDGRLGTTWLPDVEDIRPSLSLTWLGSEDVSGISIAVDEDAPARQPDRLTLVWPEGRREVTLQDGWASFPTISTDQMRIQVESAEDAINLGFDAQASDLPIGIGEVRLIGMPHAPVALPRTLVTYPCGHGPDVTINDVSFKTRITAVPADLAEGGPARAVLCEPDEVDAPLIALSSGENRVQTRPRDGFILDAVVLTQEAADVSAVVTGSSIEPSGPVTRTLTPEPGDLFVAMRENHNRGWEATVDGTQLESIVIDGWQQGWLLPDDVGTAQVDVTFAPDPVYRTGLLVGAGAVLSLLLVILFLVLSRDKEPPPLHERRLPAWLLLGILGLALGLLAGWMGVLVGGLGAVGASVLLRRVPDVAPYALGALSLAAAIDYAIKPWGSPTGWAGADNWPHYLVLVSLAGAVVSLVDRKPRPLPGHWNRAFLRRSAGRSTKR